MKFSISNIAWQENEDEMTYELMNAFGYRGIEIAPSRIWKQPASASLESIHSFKLMMTDRGIKICAMQSLLYGHPELTLFQSKEKNYQTMHFLKKMIDLASLLECEAVVFGSPKNRLMSGMNSNDAEKIAVKSFKELGDYAFTKKIDFCLEPNPKEYGADFLTNTLETVEFVKKVQSPGLWLNIDAGTIALNDENLETILPIAIPFARHLHISEPFLGEISNVSLHSKLLKMVSELKYQYWISIEMRAGLNPSNITTLKNVFTVLSTVTNNHNAK